MMEQIQREQRLATLVEYFVPAIERAENKTESLLALKDQVLGMTIDEFECIYNSLLPEEQEAFRTDREFTADEEKSQYMIFTKTLNRYWDAKASYTGMADDGVLCITENSSILELPITLDTFVELSQLGAYSIADMRKKVAENIVTDKALKDISAAVVCLMNDPTIQLKEKV